MSVSKFLIHYKILIKHFIHRALVSDTTNLATLCSMEHQEDPSDVMSDETVESIHSTASGCDEVASDSEDVTASDSADMSITSDTECDSEESDSEESDSEESDSEESVISIGSEPEDCDYDDEIEASMFNPIYKDANISLVGAYCAILEFKRSCRVPFTTIHLFKKFFLRYTSPYEKRQFCSTCNKEYKKGQKWCDNATCIRSEPNTLISYNPRRALRRVLKSKPHNYVHNALSCSYLFIL